MTLRKNYELERERVVECIVKNRGNIIHMSADMQCSTYSVRYRIDSLNLWAFLDDCRKQSSVEHVITKADNRAPWEKYYEFGIED